MAAKTPAQWKTLFENEPFHRENYYTGPLGPDYTPGGTCLRLWAPTAEAVTVTLYHKGDGGAVLGTKPLVRGAQGVWSIWLPGEQHGRYYTFAVTVNGITRETGDPYARAAGVNGVRSMIVDLARTAPSGWERDVRPNIPPAQRAVWEVSVRDFSQDAASGVRPAWRGKYMAFTQQGTTLHGDGIHPTCLNYLKRLGVKYVQLMPIFDFGSVDEAKPLLRQYNWGYDPTNFNVPEGSYSTDPTRGEVRIRECREMIAALHAAGIGVVMDVVYNHTYRTENPLNNTVPYYFFRQNADGSFSNGSGCGNEFASERPMARRYLIDSILYWAKEYHIDGFRFDLMGLYDAESINAVRAALDALPGGRDILLYGEPWQGGASQLHRYEANKANLAMLKEKQNGNAVTETVEIAAWAPADVNLISNYPTVKLNEGTSLFTDLPGKIEAIAPELKGMKAIRFNGNEQREKGTCITFETNAPVKLLVAYFKDDQKKYAKAPKLEIDASANDYGQAEPVLTNAIHINGMPLANVHAYSFPAGKHTLMLPKGYLQVLGFTAAEMKTRNAGLAGDEETMDRLYN